MKSFSPAGLATKAYFGLGARTFGNPQGHTSGGGASPALSWQTIFNAFAISSVPQCVLVLGDLTAVVGCEASGQILYTLNGGLTWATGAQTVPARVDVNALASNGAGVIVAFGDSAGSAGQLSRSVDGGATWADVTPANFVTASNGTFLNQLQWSAPLGRFVCFATDAGGNARCFTSRDGLAWSSTVLAVPGFGLGDFRATNGVIVAAGFDATHALVQYSADAGVTWSTPLSVVTATGFFNTVEFNGSAWNLTGDDGVNAFNYTSPDALSWTLANTVALNAAPPYDTLQASAPQASGAGRFVSFGNPGAATTDIGWAQSGAVWTPVTIANALSRVINAAGTLYAFGAGIDASNDGNAWVSQLAGAVDIRGLSSNAVLSLAVGLDVHGNPAILKLRPPQLAAIDWTFRGAIVGSGNTAGADHGTAIVVDGNGNVSRSTDGGATWVNTAVLGSFQAGVLADVAYGQGRWLIASSGPGGNPALWSSVNDGVSWSAIISPPALPALGEGLTSIATDRAGNWVALALTTYMVSADNGVTWTAPGLYAPGQWNRNCLAFLDGLFTATASQAGTGFSVIVTSAGGAGAWTEHVIAPTTDVFAQFGKIQQLGSQYATTLQGADAVRIASSPAALTGAANQPTGSGDFPLVLLAAGGILFAFPAAGANASFNSLDGIAWVLGGLLGMLGTGQVAVVYDSVNQSGIASGSNGVSTVHSP